MTTKKKAAPKKKAKPKTKPVNRDDYFSEENITTFGEDDKQMLKNVATFGFFVLVAVFCIGAFGWLVDHWSNYVSDADCNHDASVLGMETKIVHIPHPLTPTSSHYCRVNYKGNWMSFNEWEYARHHVNVIDLSVGADGPSTTVDIEEINIGVDDEGKLGVMASE